MSGQSSNTWLDYVTSIGTLLASLAALAAVGLTIYLSIWRARHRLPQLSLSLRQEARVGAGFDRASDSGPFVIAPIHVSNDVGKQSAHGVEVLLSAGYWLSSDPPRFHERIHQEPLTWWISDPPQGIGRASADIPAGVTRKAAILVLGHPLSVHRAISPNQVAEDEERDFLRDRFGVFALVPLSQETLIWLDDQLAYEIRLTVVAEEIDAVSYRTRLRWRSRSMGSGSDHSSELELVHPVWDELEEIPADDWPGPAPEDVSGKAEHDPFYSKSA